MPSYSPLVYQTELTFSFFCFYQGLNVQVKTKDGAEIEGLFHAASTSSDLAIVLKLARKIQKSDEGTPQGDNKTNPNPAVATMIIQAKDLVQVSAINVDFEATTKPVAEKDSKSIKLFRHRHE